MKFLEIVNKYEAVGASLITYDNGVFKEEYTGYSDIDRKTKTTENTIYRIASISKVIIAIMIMKEYEKGNIDLDIDISNYLGYTVRNPYYKDDIITTRMLMTQMSSITDCDMQGIGYDKFNCTNDVVELKDILAKSGKYYDERIFDKNKPSTEFIYSNFNCGILTCILEKITNKYYIDYVEEVLVKPLGLDASFDITRIKKYDFIASTYYYNNEGFTKGKTNDDFKALKYENAGIGNNFRGSAGGFFTSLKDLSKIMKMLIDDGMYGDIKILEKQTVDYMYQITTLFPRRDVYTCKALQLMVLTNYTKFPLRGHFGDAYGVNSLMFFDKTNKLGVCYITNGINSISDETGMKYHELEILKEFDNYEIKKPIFNLDIIKKEALVDNRIIKLDTKNKDSVHIKNLVDIYGINIIETINNEEVKIRNKKYKFNQYLNGFEIATKF